MRRLCSQPLAMRRLFQLGDCRNNGIILIGGSSSLLKIKKLILHVLFWGCVTHPCRLVPKNFVWKTSTVFAQWFNKYAVLFFFALTSKTAWIEGIQTYCHIWTTIWHLRQRINWLNFLLQILQICAIMLNIFVVSAIK